MPEPVGAQAELCSLWAIALSTREASSRKFRGHRIVEEPGRGARNPSAQSLVARSPDANGNPLRRFSSTPLEDARTADPEEPGCRAVHSELCPVSAGHHARAARQVSNLCGTDPADTLSSKGEREAKGAIDTKSSFSATSRLRSVRSWCNTSLNGSGFPARERLHEATRMPFLRPHLADPLPELSRWRFGLVRVRLTVRAMVGLAVQRRCKKRCA